MFGSNNARKSLDKLYLKCNIFFVPKVGLVFETVSSFLMFFLRLANGLFSGTNCTPFPTFVSRKSFDEERSALKLKIIQRMSASLIQFHSSDFFYAARSNACRVYKRVCS